MNALQSSRLHLRPFVADDVDALYAAVYSDPQVMQYLPGGVPRTRERTAETLSEFIKHETIYGYGGWALIRKDDGRMIGQCGLWTLESGDVEIFYAISPRDWGQGFVPEAARAVLDYAFNVASLSEIIALAVPENTGSRRVMDKIGMQFEGIINRYYNADLALYRLTHEAFHAAQS